MRADALRSRTGHAAYRVLLSVVVLLAGACADGGPPVPRPTLPAPGWSAGTGDGGTTIPLPSTPAATTGGPTGRPTASASTSGRYVFPVRATNASYHPTHSAYPGTDIFAACGTPVVAVTDGRVLEVSRVDRFDKRGPRGPFNGGLFVSLLGDDGVRYYGSHLTVVATGVEAGVRVRAGQQVGTVGRTGNANNVCHLHFGISPPCTGSDGWWIRRGVVWPAPYLTAWRRKVNRSAADEVTAWHRKHGCPAAPKAD
ncbi:M23 family metallopeptidase [Micromonospora echinofusca]|uniref:Peptidoglycan DD-metalloendopeptidase family protein n=1 Tax=Micromonospora echinofusca TaxID=47858 RepID=A0ABS3VWJ3_MICEH|nr:M23 family metallopeptidase [Micromonospora echinofusca]MBO4208868.1 peptidoglycan DD-metalloendopeptidase family protein [Micromonospora echinofusca]